MSSPSSSSPGPAQPRPPSARPLSPCVAICMMDPDSGLCRGCKRTIEEIARWSSMDDAWRWRVLDDLPNRALPPPSPRPSFEPPA